MPYILFLLLFWSVILVWLYFWVLMFANMMLFGPKELPWEYDKVIWSCLFIILPPIAPFAFWMFKNAYRSTYQNENE